MLKVISIFLTVIVAVSCDVPADCVSCDDEITEALGFAQTIINNQEPITLLAVSLCQKLIFNNITGLTRKEGTCLIPPPSGSTVGTQMLSLQVATIHVECHVQDFFSTDIADNINVQIIAVDISNVGVSIVANIDFDESTANVTTLEIDQGDFSSTKVSVQGNSTLAEIGQSFTSKSLVSNAIGYIARLIFRQFVGQFKGNPTLNLVISQIHCSAPEPEPEPITSTPTPIPGP